MTYVTNVPYVTNMTCATYMTYLNHNYVSYVR